MRIDTSFLVKTSLNTNAFWKSMIMYGPIAAQNYLLRIWLRLNNNRTKLMEQTIAMMTFVIVGKKFFETFIFVSADKVFIRKLI